LKKINEINKKTCLVECLSSEKGEKIIEGFDAYDKLLMFEIDSDIETKMHDPEIIKLNAAQIQQRLIDINYCQNHTVYKD
jgi:hypothetical protein